MSASHEFEQSGNRESLERLMAQYRPSIEQECHAFRNLSSPDLSHADLVQEVSLRVWKKISQYKGLEDAKDEHLLALTFEAWVRKTSRSVLNNLYRDRNAKKRKPTNGVQSLGDCDEACKASPTASSIVMKTEENSRVQAALQQSLDSQSREIVLLHIGGDQSFQQIADRLGISYDQARYKYRTALKLLESELT